MTYKICKRLMDICAGLTGVILFSPLMFATAMYIKLISPKGPIFVSPYNRVGLNGKEFRMYKFRTMIPNAAEWLKSQPELYKKYQENGYKLDPDPRLLKGAQYLRKYSIDELPQFFNILFGSMSLIGPRGYFAFELNEQAERYPETKDDINTALTIKPGLTGPWQVGGRSSVGFVDRIRLDAEYAKRGSIMYDIKILLRTPFVVLTGRGAS